MIDLADVQAARGTISGRITHTPLFHSTALGNRIGAQLYLKAEHLQRTGSFKPRGALNKISSLSQEERDRGIIAVSAGNHAQGVAWAATAAGASSVVVMASTASQSKIKATRNYGAEVVLVEGGIGEAFDRVTELQQERNLTLVHPFDDPLIMAGQGTVALEILEDHDDVQAIVVPIGGGGLIAGIAVAAKSINPAIRVYGVEPEGADVLYRSLEAGKPLEMEPTTVADGLASPVCGDLTYEVIKKYVDDVVRISDDEIVAGLKDLLIYTKQYVEPAGACATAALLSGKIPTREGETVVAILSGGNFDLDMLKSIL